MGEEKETIKKVDPSKIVKRIGTVLLVCAVSTAGAAIYKDEHDRDHATEFCPWCSVIGLKHQEKAINREGEFLAEYHYAGDEKVIINAEWLNLENGNKIYTAPTGYTLKLQVGDTYLTGNAMMYDENAKTFTVYNDIKADYLDDATDETFLEGYVKPAQTYTISADEKSSIIYAEKTVYHKTDYVEAYSSYSGVNSNGDVIAKTLVNTITKPKK